MTLRLGLLAYKIERLSHFDDFASKVSRAVAEAVREGAELCVLPEYACVEVASALIHAPDPHAELTAVCGRRQDLLASFREIAREHRVWLAPGSLPWREGERIRNRAPLFDPDGRLALQDKRVMTRFETESWGVQSGDDPKVFETPWGRIGIAICYDVEFPALVRAQAAAGAWLILTPSCTEAMHGFNRVRLAARARALENQCYVAVAPTVGDAPWSATLDANRGYAAVFGPVDRGFPDDGVIARGELDAGGWVYADLDADALEVVRRDGAVRNFTDWPADPPPAPIRAPE